MSRYVIHIYKHGERVVRREFPDRGLAAAAFDEHVEGWNKASYQSALDCELEAEAYREDDDESQWPFDTWNAACHPDAPDLEDG